MVIASPTSLLMPAGRFLPLDFTENCSCVYNASICPWTQRLDAVLKGHLERRQFQNPEHHRYYSDVQRMPAEFLLMIMVMMALWKGQLSTGNSPEISEYKTCHTVMIFNQYHLRSHQHWWTETGRLSSLQISRASKSSLHAFTTWKDLRPPFLVTANLPDMTFGRQNAANRMILTWTNLTLRWGNQPVDQHNHQVVLSRCNCGFLAKQNNFQCTHLIRWPLLPSLRDSWDVLQNAHKALEAQVPPKATNGCSTQVQQKYP